MLEIETAAAWVVIIAVPDGKPVFAAGRGVK
jgi:hypothetical protein